MKKAIVTGAGGFIGGALTKALLEKGYTVYGVDLNGENLTPLCNYNLFVPVEIDLKKDNLSEHIKDTVDVLYYMSWGGSMSAEDRYNVPLQTNNISVAASVCKDSVKFCRKFIFASSSYENMKSSETNSFIIDIYGIAKRAAGDICASISNRNSMDYNKVILTNTFGVGDRSKKAVNTIVTAMINNFPLKLVEGNNPNDWVYIDDTVKGLILCGENGKPFSEYYIGNSNITTFKEKILEMGIVLCPERKFTFGEMSENTYIDYTKLKDEIQDGFECKADFKESILNTAKWIKSQETDEPHRLSGGG